MPKSYEPSLKKINQSNGMGGGYGSTKENSDASSSASRFYDNGADTTSSLSDNFYSDNHKVFPQNGNKNGIDTNHNSFKMQTTGRQSSMSQCPPPINQRSSCCYLLLFYNP